MVLKSVPAGLLATLVASTGDEDTETIEVGQYFDTLFEEGCKVLTVPDCYGNFVAEDSEGIVCNFGLNMIVDVYDIDEDEDEEL